MTSIVGWLAVWLVTAQVVALMAIAVRRQMSDRKQRLASIPVVARKKPDRRC